jgi:orotate phosphoribosyltransferase
MNNEVLNIFKLTGGILTGHFLLTSGLHSETYLQCAKVLQYPEYAEQLGSMIGEAFRDDQVHVVVSPAVGGIIIGHEVARSLSARAVFAERVTGNMMLRRGFSLKRGERALLVEDVMTTGESIKETAQAVFDAECIVVGIASIIDRTGGIKIINGIKQVSLLTMDIPVYEPSACPMCNKGIPFEKPGSRELS